TARAPQRRRVDQNNDRCSVEQKRCGDPPRRTWRSCPHHEHFLSPGCHVVNSAVPRRAAGLRAPCCGLGRGLTVMAPPVSTLLARPGDEPVDAREHALQPTRHSLWAPISIRRSVTTSRNTGGFDLFHPSQPNTV